MNLMSVFDGLGGARLALERSGFIIENYYASEILPYPIGITSYNYPDTQHIGDVRDITIHTVPNGIDMLVGGSPCTNFSFAGKRKGMSTKTNIEITTLQQYTELKLAGFEFTGQSYLFFEFLRLRNIYRPKFVLLENVRMTQKWQTVLSNAMGFEPQVIDSRLVSGQRRYRNYWFGQLQADGSYKQCAIDTPQDAGVELKHILHENVDLGLYGHSEKAIAYMNSVAYKDGRTRWDLGLHHSDQDAKSHCVTANHQKGVPYNVLLDTLAEYVVPYEKTVKILEEEVQRGKIDYYHVKDQKSYFVHNRVVSPCDKPDLSEPQQMDTLLGCITPDRVNKKQNGQRFSDSSKHYTLTATDGAHGILTEQYIRKLTEIEAERLQTYPDDYTKYAMIDGKVKEVPKTHRYSATGNGWTTDAVLPFFNYMRDYYYGTDNYDAWLRREKCA